MAEFPRVQGFFQRKIEGNLSKNHVPSFESWKESYDLRLRWAEAGGNWEAVRQSHRPSSLFCGWSFCKIKLWAGWWFQTFFIFTFTLGIDPIWLIFFKWVETTNLWVTDTMGIWLLQSYLQHTKTLRMKGFPVNLWCWERRKMAPWILKFDLGKLKTTPTN